MPNDYPPYSIEWYLCEYDPEGKVGQSRHDKTQFKVRLAIADFVQHYGPEQGSLLEIGGFTGWHTVAYRDRLKNPAGSTIYDWQDWRTAKVRQVVGFKRVNLE